MTQTQTINAQDLFRRAYENRYTWDVNFPGYTADIIMKRGELTESGKIKINSDLQFEITGINNKQSLQAIKNQLWEITIHRVKHSFEKTHGENTFSFGETDEPDSTTILVGGKGEGNLYKVCNNIVKFVHRRIGDKIVNINTTKTQNTPEGYLALEYNSTYIDEETNESLGGKTFTQDDFIHVGNYYILSRRIIESHQELETRTVEFHFSNICLI
jgi:hypothetical protein